MTPPNATPTRADVLREPNDLTALREGGDDGTDR